MKNKKGVSDIVITVSLILVAIVAVGIIASFVVPLVQKQLAQASSCLALREHYQIRTELTATCYTATDIKLSIQRSNAKEDSKGFSVTIFSSTGEANSYQNLTSLPTKGGAKVYTFPRPAGGSVEKVTIATILPNSDVCDGIEYTGIRVC